ncbi:uncharacterized protein LOC102405260 isoform X2 [Bubalus bubalis]|uniref:uncharacterized protein LOC102405260 isoform X2 n=1 Tax=Bubalus bubalis TaxID=89462 RepID=UPI000DBCAA63|nr:uncharacterized protein LOC102405260 isoform X2 [Bubalus bubalis]
MLLPYTALKLGEWRGTQPYMYKYLFSLIPLPSRLPHNIEQSSICYTEFYSVLSHDHKEGSSQGAAPGTVAAGAPIPTVSDCQLTPAQETLQHWQVGPEPQAWNKCCLLQEALSEHPGTEGFAHMNVLVALACVPLSPSPVNSFLMNPASPAMVGPHVPEGWAWPPPLLPQQVAPSTSRAQEDRASLGPGTTETLGCGTAVLLHRWAMER